MLSLLCGPPPRKTNISPCPKGPNTLGGETSRTFQRFVGITQPRNARQRLGVGRCRGREIFDWQEPRKFDCWLVWTIFIFSRPSPISTSRWRVARKSNFDSELDLFPLSWHHPSLGGEKRWNCNKEPELRWGNPQDGFLTMWMTTHSQVFL